MSEDGQILAITRNFDCNEFLDESFLYEMERLRRFDPDRYRVVAMGEWGTNGGIIYTKWRIESFAWTQKFGDGWVYRYGMDFGFVESPTAIVKLAVNREKRLIYVCDAVYLYAKVSTEIAEACRRMGIAECPFSQTVPTRWLSRRLGETESAALTRLRRGRVALSLG